MGTLVDDLLEFSRLGRRAVTLARVDANALVASAVEEMNEGIEGRAAAESVEGEEATFTFALPARDASDPNPIVASDTRNAEGAS